MNYKIFNTAIKFPYKDEGPVLLEKIKSQNFSETDLENFSMFLADSGNYSDALRLFVGLSQSDLNNKYFYLLQSGYCNFLMENYTESIKSISEYIEHNDDDYQAHVILGMAYYYLGLFNRANKHWWAAHIIDENEFILKIMGNFFTDEFHPERMELFPLCKGRGIDVGCGHRKTNPNCIGVDLNVKGEIGKFGNVKGFESVADIKASGDNLYMFKDNELDFVVQRHNLEHYKDIILTLQEWKRVLKPGGILGMVVPDDDVCNTISLDPTHYHVFTQASMQRILMLIGGFKILKMQPLLKNWSFVCIAQKIENCDNILTSQDIDKIIFDFEKSLLIKQAEVYKDNNLSALSKQCYEFEQNLK